MTSTTRRNYVNWKCFAMDGWYQWHIIYIYNILNPCQRLLLSYHRRLRMDFEVLELCVEGGRVSHSWCMCVVGHGYGEFGWGSDEGGRWYACVTMPVLVACQEMLEHFSSVR